MAVSMAAALVGVTSAELPLREESKSPTAAKAKAKVVMPLSLRSPRLPNKKERKGLSVRIRLTLRGGPTMRDTCSPCQSTASRRLGRQTPNRWVGTAASISKLI